MSAIGIERIVLRASCASLLIFSLVITAPAFAGFASDTGRVLVPRSNGTSLGESGNTLVRQSDGKLLLAGDCYGPTGGEFCVTRLNADGSYDTSFDGGVVSPAIPGKVTYSVIGQLTSDLRAIAVGSDNKIVLAGTCQPNPFSANSALQMCAVRLNANGSLDANFNAAGTNGASAGRVSFRFNTSTVQRVGGVAVQPLDGKIIIVGQCGGNQCVARLNADGNFDTSLGAAANEGLGRFAYTIAPFRDERADAVVLDAAANIIIAGSCSESPLALVRSICVAKFNNNGSLDASFDGPSGAANGAFRFQVFRVVSGMNFVINEETRALALDGSKIVLLCKHDFNGASGCVYRFNSDGSLDTSFAAIEPLPGKVIYQVGTIPAYQPFALAVDASSPGRLVVTGQCGAVPGPEKVCVSRLTNVGAQDATFSGPAGDGAGGFSFDVGPGFDTGFGVVSDASGNVVIGGTCDINACVLGFKPNGAVDSSACTADLDGDGTVRSGIDGINIVRAMRNAPGSNALARGLGFDVDGDGVIDPARDGVIILRALLGFTGAAVTNGITFAIHANRKTWPEIKSYLNTRCGALL